MRNDGDYLEGYIVDLLALIDRIDVADALIRDACGVFDDLGVNAIHYLVVRGHPYRELANRFGFVDTSRFSKTYVILDTRGIDAKYRALRSSPPSRIYFNYGDYN